MPITPQSRDRVLRCVYVAVYVAAVVFMIVKVLRCGVPGHGFAWMPQFGEKFESRMSDRFRAESRCLVTSNEGYDGQFYAQLAVDPLLTDPQTLRAFDNLHFRARRPLIPLLAHLAGGGDPGTVVQAFCVANLVFWVLFAGLLTRWLPPVSWQNTFRYVAILYSAGFVASITRSLLDGPATVLVAVGVYLVESRRPWLGAITLALATLGKETGLLATSVFGLPKLSDPRGIARWILRATVVVLPLACWIGYLSTRHPGVGSDSLGPSGSTFDWPMFGWWKAVRQLVDRVAAGQGARETAVTIAFLIALPTQAIALLAMRRPSSRWWRVGAVFAVFSFVVGIAAWEGPYGSVTRICLPVSVALNITAPRTKGWFVVLVVGNALSWIGFREVSSLRPPTVVAGEDLRWSQSGEPRNARERRLSGPATLEIRNPKEKGLFVILRFRTVAPRPTQITVSLGDRTIHVLRSDPTLSDLIEIGLRLEPGWNTVRFVSAEPATGTPASFSLINTSVIGY